MNTLGQHVLLVIIYCDAYLGMPRLHCELVCAHVWPTHIVCTRAMVWRVRMSTVLGG